MQGKAVKKCLTLCQGNAILYQTVLRMMLEDRADINLQVFEEYFHDYNKRRSS